MINIVDGIPGLGKTQFAIQMINNHILEFWGDFESSDAYSKTKFIRHIYHNININLITHYTCHDHKIFITWLFSKIK